MDLLIALTRLSNKAALQSLSDEIKKDVISSKIMELTEEPKTYSDLLKTVSEGTGASEITVRRKIAALKETGLLLSKKEGRESFYENSGLLA